MQDDKSQSAPPSDAAVRSWFLRICGGFFLLIAFLTIVEVVLYVFGHGWNDEVNKWGNLDVPRTHWPAIFAFPLLAFFALFLVLLTKFVSGEVKFELGPAKISGAASEGLMWILVFLSLVWGFETLWKLEVKASSVSEITPTLWQNS